MIDAAARYRWTMRYLVVVSTITLALGILQAMGKL